jgi:hypothetical protein
MNKIPSLKQILPQSPDEIQRFSSEASAAPARLSHLNRAALYFGMDVEFIEIDWDETSEIFITKPSGYVRVLNINLSPDSSRQMAIIWDSALYQGSKSIKTPYYAQFTAISSNKPNFVYPITNPEDTLDGSVKVEYYSTEGADEVSFFYSIIPQ